MSYADKVFIDMCRDIIDNGTSTEGEKVRPVWEDGTSAYTIKRFGVVNRYDLSKEFPALTLRRTAIKSCVDELLWIWQKKSNRTSRLFLIYWMGRNCIRCLKKTSNRTYLSFNIGMEELGGKSYNQLWKDSNFTIGDLPSEVNT